LCDVLEVEGGLMDEWEMECLDCGWRGMASELNEEANDPGDRSLASCPECGGPEFKKQADREEKESA
jgi:NAD-dependent SIR2 family protein deacetylase